MPEFSEIGWWIRDHYIEFSKDYLMMTVKMKGWGTPGTTTKFGCDVNISLCTRKNFPINE